MSNEPFIDFVVEIAKTKIPKPLLKRMLRTTYITLKAEITFGDDEQSLNEIDKTNRNKFIKIIKDYKESGYTIGEALNDLQKQLESYPALQIRELPKMVYYVWDKC